ncbi:FAD-dependent oxidoreductase [Pararhizobium sp. YC-54]|uniref:FAD-dependent oxidoreductase n=1 Tax=Pararhizobium sp. YC-54 TaxID=2986920 RepID=UPI0021F7727A|nr:FAD-dependent oxidoreductase [Pararhizobium sp. YC-54]MCV9999302.1 FAD-dependent oxidoreductase [Pararhizobium sp. YC-54]
MNDETFDVAIAGGGPFGLMIANELGRRGVSVILFDEKSSTAFNPQANATQARTMEHFRRLGFAEEVRALGLPEDFPTDIAYFTRYAHCELARFRLPSARQAREKVATMSGSWSAAELPHRVSQKFVEQVLRRQAEALENVEVHYGWSVSCFEDTGEKVLVQAKDVESGTERTVRSKYFIGADGAKSAVRKSLGIRYEGDGGAIRDFFGGRMFALYLRCPQFYEVVPFAPAWMNVTFNPDRRAFMAAVDGKGEFAFHTQLRQGETDADISDSQAIAMFQAAVGFPVEAEILSRGTWMAGYALVAEKFGSGRVFLGGDAVHLFTPAGGLGYNTAVDDAVNLGWKIAAVVKGIAPQSLLETYEMERRPMALRNTGFAKRFAESIGNYAPQADLEADTERGEAARRAAGAYLEAHGRAEFNIPGITFGSRYDHSPAILTDALQPQEDAPDVYLPTAAPGGRAPHAWLESGVSLYDLFGFEWSLLRFSRSSSPGDALIAAARAAGMDLTVVDLDRADISSFYEEPLVLVRPDQIVAWRGRDDHHAEAIIATVLGYKVEESRRWAG